MLSCPTTRGIADPSEREVLCISNRKKVTTLLPSRRKNSLLGNVPANERLSQLSQ